MHDKFKRYHQFEANVDLLAKFSQSAIAWRLAKHYSH